MFQESYNQTISLSNKIFNAIDVELLNNISVTTPYFALTDIKELDEYIYASIEVELNDPEEKMPISTPEVGRHLAILGSLALSKANPLKEKHYYLATEAIIVRMSEHESKKSTLKGRATVKGLDRKNGVVSTELYDAEHYLIFKAEIKYTILHYRLFERMFASNRVELSCNPEINPYTENTAFTELELGMKNCFASIGEVLPEHCVGHFINYPALPVARIGAAMGKLAAAHFKYANPGIKGCYTVESTEIKATRLVFIGEKVHFVSEIADPNPGKGMILKVITYNDKQEEVASSVSHFYY